jgi:hypothetical protein
MSLLGGVSTDDPRPCEVIRPILPIPFRTLDPRANRGYVKRGRERVTNSTDPNEIAELRRTAPDVKESMEIGLETGTPSNRLWSIRGRTRSNVFCRSGISELLASRSGRPRISVDNDQLLRRVSQVALRCTSGGCSWSGYVRTLRLSICNSVPRL